MNPLELLEQQLAQGISAKILTDIRGEVILLLKTVRISYSEKEAAEILGMSKDALAVIRKKNGIGYSQTIAPPRGKNHGGRFVYLQHHLLDYLSRNEVNPVGKQAVRLIDIYGIKKAA